MKLPITISIFLSGFFLGWNATAFALDMSVISGVMALLCSALVLVTLKEDMRFND